MLVSSLRRRLTRDDARAQKMVKTIIDFSVMFTFVDVKNGGVQTLDFFSVGLFFRWTFFPLDFISVGLFFRWTFFPLDFFSVGLFFRWTFFPASLDSTSITNYMSTQDHG